MNSKEIVSLIIIILIIMLSFLGAANLEKISREQGYESGYKIGRNKGFFEGVRFVINEWENNRDVVLSDMLQKRIDSVIESGGKRVYIKNNETIIMQ